MSIGEKLSARLPPSAPPQSPGQATSEFARLPSNFFFLVSELFAGFPEMSMDTLSKEELYWRMHPVRNGSNYKLAMDVDHAYIGLQSTALKLATAAVRAQVAAVATAAASFAQSPSSAELEHEHLDFLAQPPNPKADPTAELCTKFAQGGCLRGNRCNFVHACLTCSTATALATHSRAQCPEVDSE